MASIDEYFATRQSLWGQFKSSDNPSIAVTEVLRSGRQIGSNRTIHSKLRNEDIHAWLEDGSALKETERSSSDEVCMLRIAWFPHDRTTGINDVGRGVLEMVTSSFHQQLAQARFRSTFAGASSIVEPSNGSRSYYICNHPHLAMTWSRCTRSAVLNIICIAHQRKIDLLQDLVSCGFFRASSHVELAPILMCFTLLCREADGMLNKVKHQVRQTEVRTGHHDFMSRSEPPAPGDLIRILADMSGCLSNLAVLRRREGIFEELKKFAVDELTKLRLETAEYEGKESLVEFTSSLQTIQQHSAIQRHDTEFFIRRAQIQRDALLHLVTENDYLAKQVVARDSYRLADIAHKDSAGVQTLTILATLFIPPTFVASLFSTPLFDWITADGNLEGEGTAKGGKSALLYIAITGPLMLVTLFIWGILTVLRRLRHSRELRHSRLMMSHSDDYYKSEVISLVDRRTNEMTESSVSGHSDASFVGGMSMLRSCVSEGLD